MTDHLETTKLDFDQQGEFVGLCYEKKFTGHSSLLLTCTEKFRRTTHTVVHAIIQFDRTISPNAKPKGIRVAEASKL